MFRVVRWLFSSCSEPGLFSSCGAQASRRSAFSLCGTQALEFTRFSGGGAWAQRLCGMWISQIGDWIYICSIGRRTFYHWATREALFHVFLIKGILTGVMRTHCGQNKCFEMAYFFNSGDWGQSAWICALTHHLLKQIAWYTWASVFLFFIWVCTMGIIT